MMKVMTIVGTRPEIIRLSSVIKELDKHSKQILVHTGQNWDYTLNEIFFNDLELRQPDHYLGVVGNHLGETMGNIIAKSYEILQKEKPDALLLLGDTNSCLAAISAKRLKIPVFHMEAGNRCFDQNVPEEINRKIVDNVSDVNLVYTEHSRRYLLREGFSPEFVLVTGSPMAEVIEQNKHKIEASKVLDELQLEKNRFFIVSSHREENIDNERNFMSLFNTINTVAEKYDIPVVISTHPRTLKKIEEHNFKFHHNVKILKPFAFSDYIKLQKSAYCVLSDSGTLSEEAAILDFPAISIREVTERPEALDMGNVILSGIDKNILDAIEISVKQHDPQMRVFSAPNDYREINVSKKVTKIIYSMTKLVNKKIWYKK